MVRCKKCRNIGRKDGDVALYIRNNIQSVQSLKLNAVPEVESLRVDNVIGNKL